MYYIEMYNDLTGSYDMQSTGVHRTLGWHKFSIDVQSTGITWLINDQILHSMPLYAGVTGIDRVGVLNSPIAYTNIRFDLATFGDYQPIQVPSTGIDPIIFGALGIGIGALLLTTK